MSDSKNRNSFKDRSVSRKISSIHKQKLATQKVVNLFEYREVKKMGELRTILVVDDEEIMCTAIKRMLEKDGYHVLVANDGQDFSKIIETTKLDMILLDVNLPWVNGYDICKVLKAHPKLRSIPVFFVSARASEEDIRKGYDSGCDDYITKPFDVTYMMEIIQKTLLKTS